MTFRSGTNVRGSSTAPAVTIPGSLSTDDVVIVVLSLNNTNTVNSTPGKVSIVGSALVSSTLTGILYVGVVGQAGLASGDTLTWGLSSSRLWQLNVYVGYGYDVSASPIHTSNAASSVTTTAVTPSLTTTENTDLIEVAVGKSNGTAVTSWSAPTNWTNRQERDATTTFEPSSVIGDYNLNPAAPGTYGSDTWTPNQAVNITARWTVALKLASGTGWGMPL